jgi:hypothetical protein
MLSIIKERIMPEQRREPALSRDKAPKLVAGHARLTERAGGQPTTQTAGVQQLAALVGNRAAAAFLQARAAAPFVAADRLPASRVPQVLTGLGGPVMQRATWKDFKLDRQVDAARARVTFTDAQDILFGLREDQKARLRSRIEITLYRLELGLAHNWLGDTHDLVAKIGGLLRTEPDKVEVGKSPAEVVAKKISEDLSELEHAADVVLRHGEQDMAVSKVHVGAKGPDREGGDLPLAEKTGIAGFEKEGVLPPIDEPQLQADSYYRSRDGFVHVVEIKDTVNALRSKLRAERQYERQVRWLARYKGTDAYKRVVEYFIQDPTPFHRLLDGEVLGPFGTIEKAQLAPGQDWFKLGDEKFTFNAFNSLYKQAMSVFGPNIARHHLTGARIGTFLDQYFGTKELARASIASPEIMEGFTG